MICTYYITRKCQGLNKLFLYFRQNVEPSVNLRYGSQGTDSSSISMNPNPIPSTSANSNTSNTNTNTTEAATEEDTGIRNLPGPRQVITDPGVPGTNPVTGERQRRRGVSGPPSGL